MEAAEAAEERKGAQVAREIDRGAAERAHLAALA